MGKKKFNLKVEASDSIKDVKAKIQEQEKLTPDKYSLSFDTWWAVCGTLFFPFYWFKVPV